MRSRFDPLVDDYDAARPSYPVALYDAIEGLAGLLRGADVVEVGAGTGLSTAGLVARGARVLACDIGMEMLRRLPRRAASALPVVADGQALPVRDESVDLVCYAQAWHWVDVDRAAADAARVLRDDGSLALWWNTLDLHGVPWFEQQQDRIERLNPAYSRDYRSRDFASELRATGLFDRIESVSVRWARDIDFSLYERWLRSKSYIAAIGDRLEEFIAAERASLSAAFPSGVVHEPFVTSLWVARKA